MSDLGLGIKKRMAKEKVKSSINLEKAEKPEEEEEKVVVIVNSLKEEQEIEINLSPEKETFAPSLEEVKDKPSDSVNLCV